MQIRRVSASSLERPSIRLGASTHSWLNDPANEAPEAQTHYGHVKRDHVSKRIFHISPLACHYGNIRLMTKGQAMFYLSVVFVKGNVMDWQLIM